jgi:TonB family protein
LFIYINKFFNLLIRILLNVGQLAKLTTLTVKLSIQREFNMSKFSFCIFAILLNVIIYFNGYSYSDKLTGSNRFSGQIITNFSNAYQSFEAKDYLSAKEKFINAIKLDTNNFDFESYAFLAECYRQLGNQDSGKIIYEQGIKNLGIIKIKDSTFRSMVKFDLDTLKAWYNNYPEFPNSLKSENGFLPWDSMPKVLHMVSPVYPEEAKVDRIEGFVMVKVLINTQGLPINEFVIKTSNAILNDAAIQAAKAFTFIPYKRKGAGEKFWMVVPFKFHLDR